MTSKPPPRSPAPHAPGRQPAGATAWREAPHATTPATPRPDSPDGQLPAAGPGGDRTAALGYLAVLILGLLVPLVIFVLRRRGPDYARRNSVQALNLSLTMLLYGVCILIAGLVLTLDSAGVALVVVIVLAAALWLVTLAYAIMAATSAYRGGFRRIPAWLCATMVR